MAMPLFARQHSLAYALLAPLAVVAILIWLPLDQYTAPIATAFAVLSALLLWLFPRDLVFAPHWRDELGRMLVAVLVAALVSQAARMIALPSLLIALLCLWLLRLWYIRQFHRKQGNHDSVELLRRCLLIALWSHISVLTALWSPY